MYSQPILQRKKLRQRQVHWVVEVNPIASSKSLVLGFCATWLPKPQFPGNAVHRFLVLWHRVDSCPLMLLVTFELIYLSSDKYNWDSLGWNAGWEWWRGQSGTASWRRWWLIYIREWEKEVCVVEVPRLKEQYVQRFEDSAQHRKLSACWAKEAMK